MISPLSSHFRCTRHFSYERPNLLSHLGETLLGGDFGLFGHVGIVGSSVWSSDEQSDAELRHGKGEKHNSPFQSSRDASWVFFVRLFKILETFRGRLLGFVGNIRVVDGPEPPWVSERCSFEGMSWITLSNPRQHFSGLCQVWPRRFRRGHRWSAVWILRMYLEIPIRRTR